MQRVRIGFTGLAAILLLVALASAVFRSASHEPPAVAAGAASAVATNLANGATEAPNEPLADLGGAPGAESDAAPSPAPPTANSAKPR